MSYQIAIEQVRTSTPRRLVYKRDEQEPKKSEVPIVFGTKMVTGEYVELTQDSKGFLWVRERRSDGKKEAYRSVYDPTQTGSIVGNCFSAMDSYRSSLGYVPPNDTLRERNGWPLTERTLGQISTDFRRGNVRDLSNYPVMQPVMSWDPLKAPPPIQEMFRAYAGYTYYFWQIFNTQGSSTVPDSILLPLNPVHKYEVFFGGLGAEISLLEATVMYDLYFQQILGGIDRPTSVRNTPIVAQLNAQFFAPHMFQWFSWILNSTERLFSVVATFEEAYFQLSKLPDTGYQLTLITEFLEKVNAKLKTLLAQRAHVIDVLIELVKLLRKESPIQSFHVVQNLVKEYLLLSNAMGGAAILQNLWLAEWEEYAGRLAEVSVPVSGKTITEIYYSGASSFGVGPIDTVSSLSFNGIPLQNGTRTGSNTVYSPLLFGGFDTGLGGIGSSSKQIVTIESGTADQKPQDLITREDRNPYHYRHIAHLAFDNYNLGGGATAPEIRALVTRINKQLDGSDQWQPRWSTITTKLPDGMMDNHYVYILISYASRSEGSLVLSYFQRVAKGTQTFRIGFQENRLYDVVLNSATIADHDFSNEGWIADLSSQAPDSGVPVKKAEFDDRFSGAGAPGGIPAVSLLVGLDEFASPGEVYVIKDPIPDLSLVLQTNVETGKRFSRENIASAWTMNPIHMLREVMTNKDNNWAYGIDESKIDDVSFLEAAKTCYRERLGCSYVNNSNASADTLYAMLRDYVSCAIEWVADKKHYRIKLIRADYEIKDLKILDESNVSSIGGYQRNYNAKPTSLLTLTYRNFEDVDTFVALTAPNFTLNQNAQRINYPCCPDEITALRVASRDLAIANNSPLTLTVTVSIDTSDTLRLGDPVIVNWPSMSLEGFVARVVSVSVPETDIAHVKLVQEMFIPLQDDLVAEQPKKTKPQVQRGWGFDWGNNWGGT